MTRLNKTGFGYDGRRLAASVVLSGVPISHSPLCPQISGPR